MKSSFVSSARNCAINVDNPSVTCVIQLYSSAVSARCTLHICEWRSHGADRASVVGVTNCKFCSRAKVLGLDFWKSR
jgi:hypothetical protein